MENSNRNPGGWLLLKSILLVLFLIIMGVCFMGCSGGGGGGATTGAGATPTVYHGMMEVTVVRDDNQTAINNATVALVNLQDGTLSGLTNTSGYYKFSNIPEEAYTLLVTAEGFMSFEQTGVAVTANTLPYNIGLVVSDNPPVFPPIINHIDPTNGSTGAIVTFVGSSFGENRGKVYFNGTAATEIVSWTSIKIQAKVPSAATTGPVKVETDVGESNIDQIFTKF